MSSPKSSSPGKKASHWKPKRNLPLWVSSGWKIRFKKDVQDLGVWKYTKGVQARERRRKKKGGENFQLWTPPSHQHQQPGLQGKEIIAWRREGRWRRWGAFCLLMISAVHQPAWYLFPMRKACGLASYHQGKQKLQVLTAQWPKE